MDAREMKFEEDALNAPQKNSKNFSQKIIDLTGQTFGALRVLSYAKSKGQALWLCRCTCGAERVVRGDHLRSGHARSCRKPGCSRHPLHVVAASEYRCWQAMRQRCYNVANPPYAYYGGRGIKVHKRWRNDFQQFLADMGPRPSPKHSLDRYPDNDGDYAPGNVRWATAREQSRNTRKTRFVFWEGKRVLLIDLAARYGLKPRALLKRLARGWDLERSLLEPRYSRRAGNSELAQVLYLQTDAAYKELKKKKQTL